MKSTFPFLIAFLFGLTLFAQKPVMLNDFTTTGAGSFRSEPFFKGIETDDFLYFEAETDELGKELYRTNGTEIGTQLLKDIRPGSASSSIVFWLNRGNTIYFSATNEENGYELWTSQGTTTSTRMVADLNEGPQGGVFSSQNLRAMFKDKLYFRGRGANGDELYRLDESDNSLDLVRDIYPGTSSFGSPNSGSVNYLTPGDNLMYFTANDGVHGNELWVTDGTFGGTRMIRDINEGTSWSNFTGMEVVNDVLIFLVDDGVHGREPWISTGFQNTTLLLKDITPGEDGTSVKLVGYAGNRYYFIVRESNTQRILWETTGTESGTVEVLDSVGERFNVRDPFFIGDQLYFKRSGRLWTIDPVLNKPVQVTSRSMGSVVGTDSLLYFVSNAGEQGNFGGKGIWKTDGTEGGTVLIKEVNTSSTQDIDNLYLVGNQLFFIAETEAFGRELWTSDGTEEGTFMLIDSEEGEEDGFESYHDVSFYQLKDKLIYAGFDLENGRELWTSDGTTEGTKLLRDIDTQNEGIQLYSHPISFKEGTYFSTNEGLWKTDGTAESTKLIWESNTLFGFNEFNDKLFFTARSEGNNARTIWTTDGTASGTQMLLDSATAANRNFLFRAGMPIIGNTMFFNGSAPQFSNELWKTDGTAEGTKMVKDIHPTSGSLFSFQKEEYTVYKDELFFVADDGEIGSELWKSDGTEEGTVPVTDINPTGSSWPREMIELNDNLIFIADDGTGGRELWKTDGTVGGALLVKDIYTGEEDGLSFNTKLVKFNGFVYFSADSDEYGRELWKTDGTEEGTVIVKNIAEGSLNSNPNYLYPTDSVLYFVASDSLGRRIWTTDGTEEGTVPFLDLDVKSDFVPVNGSFFFSAEDEKHGRELWRSDGTVEGTMLAADIFEGATNSSPMLSGYTNGSLYFTAIDKDFGRELWALTPLKIDALLESNAIDICAPDTTVVFTANAENAGENPSYRWLLNDQVIDNENGSMLSLDNLEDGDEIKFQVISDNTVWVSNDSTFSNVITIRYSPLDPQITVAGNQLSSTEGASYQWYFDGELLTNVTRSITAENSGEYQVEVFNDAGCSFFSEKVNVIVCNPEKPAIQVNGDVLTVNQTGTYKWFLNGAQLSQTSQSITVTEVGKYKVEVTDAQGCIATSDEVDYGITGLKDIRLLEGVELYPNPASDALTIESNMAEELEANIFSVSGQIMFQGKLSPTSTTKVALERFPQGLYILKMRSRRGVYQHKFLKN